MKLKDKSMAYNVLEYVFKEKKHLQKSKNTHLKHCFIALSSHSSFLCEKCIMKMKDDL